MEFNYDGSTSHVVLTKQNKTYKESQFIDIREKKNHIMCVCV